MAELAARLEALAESAKPAATLIEGYRAVLFTPGGSDAETVKAKESALKYVRSPARGEAAGDATLRVLHRMTSGGRTLSHPRYCHASPRWRAQSRLASRPPRSRRDLCPRAGGTRVVGWMHGVDASAVDTIPRLHAPFTPPRGPRRSRRSATAGVSHRR
jgi:hypothetical protein